MAYFTDEQTPEMITRRTNEVKMIVGVLSTSAYMLEHGLKIDPTASFVTPDMLALFAHIMNGTTAIISSEIPIPHT